MPPGPGVRSVIIASCGCSVPVAWVRCTLPRTSCLERQVAIEFLVSTSHTDDPTLARRLLKEAKGVAAIEHPNICPVFDAGMDADGRPFIVMQ